MPASTDRYSSRYDRYRDRYRDRYDRYRREPSRSTQPSLEQQVAELEALREASGAPQIEQDRPGAFRTIIDVLSRPNYAVAGLAEELIKNRSVTGGVTRALAEIFSGVGPVQGQKRAFGEVMEGLGVGTTTLADAFPALEGTWVGSFGSRGAAGLALDIALDPLTYMTFGGSGVAKIISKVGGKPAVRFLNAAGLGERAKITQEIMGSLGPESLTAERRFAKQLYGTVDDFSVRRGRLRLNDEIERRLLQRVTDATGEVLPEFADKGGIKLFGKSVIPSKTIREFSAPIVNAASRIPGGDLALEGAKQFGDGLRGAMRQMFSSKGVLANLPKAEREIAWKLRRDFMNASAAHRGRLISQAKVLERGYRELEKADPLIGKKWYDIREGVRPNDLKGDERALYEQTMNMYDQMRETLVAHGVLDPEQVARVPYIFHGYKNLEDLSKYHWNSEAPFSGVLSEQFTRERAFDRFEDAVLESRRLNAIQGAGKESRVYPVLEPEYDVFKNIDRYIGKHSDALARQAWREEVLAKFGQDVSGHDIDALYDIAKPVIDPASKTYAKIERFFDNSPTFTAGRKIAEETLRVGSNARTDIEDAIMELERHLLTSSKEMLGKSMVPVLKRQIPELAEVIRRSGGLQGSDLLAAKKIVMENEQLVGQMLGSRGGRTRIFDPGAMKPAPTRERASREFLNAARREMSKLDGDGKREFLRQLITRADSSSNLAAIEKELWDEYASFFPRMQAWKAGEVAPSMAKTLGERAAEMIPVKTKWTGDQGVMLPRAIWDDLQAVNSKLLNTADFKEFGKLVNHFDFLNNSFKLGVYGLWIPSAVRDAYNNVFLSMLDVSVQALNPRYYIDAIGVMAGRNGEMVTKQGVRWSWASLKEMAKDFGVWVPGEVFAELTGDPSKWGTKVNAVKKVIRARGMIENEARMALWLANIRRGVDPRAAADHVGEFLFNYGELSQVERELFRRLIPFYTFTRKNIQLQVKALRENPGMVINQLKPFLGRNDENEQMVQWEAEALKMRLDRDGKTVHMITGIDLPFRNLDTLWRGDFGRTGRSLMGMMSPVLKTIPEVLLNHDTFLGRDLTRTQSDFIGRLLDKVPTPGSFKDWLGYKKEVDAAGRPRYTFDGRRFTLVFRSWMLSRAISTSDRQFREYIDNGDFQWQRSLLDVLTGFRRKDLDMDDQMRRRMEERIRQLEQSLARRGVMGTFEKRFQPKQKAGQSVEFR